MILHSRADDVIPFADSEELVRNSGLPASALIEVGSDHRLADPEPLEAMLRACEVHYFEEGRLMIVVRPLMVLLLIFGIGPLCFGEEDRPAKPESDMTYLENGIIKVGVDLGLMEHRVFGRCHKGR